MVTIAPNNEDRESILYNVLVAMVTTVLGPMVTTLHRHNIEHDNRHGSTTVGSLSTRDKLCL